MTRRVIILGAAGRDFHNFNVVYRDDPSHQVVAFTATQIPGIEGRVYPRELAGRHYPNGIPIEPESELPRLIRELDADACVFSYSDVSYAQVMHLASLCVAEGADFELLGAERTMLQSEVPVIAVTAVRTGAGKSQTTRFIAGILKKHGKRVVVVRHPMPYGDLAAQNCQRFATYDDLTTQHCTIEEREEYEQHIDNGLVVYAGVDYERILNAAEAEADVILWDGGNNDLPFFEPSLHICVADPHRAGHEVGYWPGEANFRRADLILINKCDTAGEADIRTIEENARKLNPEARVVRAASPVSVDQPELVRGKRALVIEDGPTLTHGGMKYGAGVIAARSLGAEIVQTVPAMGYSDEQVRELEETIRDAAADVIVIGTPVDLRRILTITRPAVRVRYELRELEPGKIEPVILSAAKDPRRRDD